MSNHKPGGDDAARCYPSQTTDAMWAVIEPLLPVRDSSRDRRPRIYPDRPVLDAIFYVLRSACQWRMLPHDLVPWWTALLVVAVTAASVQDRPGGKAVLAQLATRFPSVSLAWADGGYANEIDDGLVRWAAHDLGPVTRSPGPVPPNARHSAA